ncbi:MAG: tRNA (guanosine(37)-N1)-methyltransferase TrmD [Actinobacteria bacterium]|nr:tRNA (guanosine(37)-N1)-methyltransferase TrmD [Actinomycetota bacterium]MBL7060402.1 tRNA (guanosine(37)-N1)-methyltransferase TrmD [Actinomycetota bacterium]
MLIIDVISIFPKMFNNIINYGVIKEAFNKNLCQLNIYNLREFTDDKHKKIDDRPFGGGPGMVMNIQPIDSAVNFIKKKNNIINKELQKTILLSPKGLRLSQSKLKYLSNLENIIIICGRYEGVDERVKELVVDMELSIGDYVLTGGEIPSMVVIDGVIRLLSGVVGKEESLKYESFEDNLLDYPQYTRPLIYKGYKVPEILLSGNHKEIEKWRKEEAISLTKKRRPDLFDKYN